MPYSMTRRQRHLYTDSIVVFTSGGRGVIVNATSGEPVPSESVATIQGPFPCKYTSTENVDDPSGVGKIKRFELDTADWIHFPCGVPIKDADYVVNITRLPDGTRQALFGMVNKILGAAKIKPGANRRKVNMTYYRILDDEHPPQYIADYLATLP